MLGVQDFCGYYDWTFQHIRRHFGQAALREFMATAIGLDSQQHYLANGKRAGLRGLYETWHTTGKDEKCDWTFTLDEASNVLRWDMRECPSKGFLLKNDLHTDEDYCDHCIGWVRSMLGKLDMEMVHHEHNHCGQCWGEMRVKGKPYKTLQLDYDIRKDARWNAGHLDRFVEQEKAPSHPEFSDSADVQAQLADWLGGRELIVARNPAEVVDEAGRTSLVSATDYVNAGAKRCLVLIESPPSESGLGILSAKLQTTAPADQPLLIYPYLPQFVAIRFAAVPLPRPLTILPMLIRAGAYVHDPSAPPLPTFEWMRRIASTIDAARH